MRYVVARVITSPAGAIRTARLMITDVPDKTTVKDVLKALEEAGKAADFSEAGVPFGNHEIKADKRGWPFGISGIDEATSITWAELNRILTRNEGRRVTLRLTDAEYSSIALASQREGLSIQTWCLEHLTAAAKVPETPAAAPAPKVTKAVRRPSVPAGKVAAST